MAKTKRNLTVKKEARKPTDSSVVELINEHVQNQLTLLEATMEIQIRNCEEIFASELEKIPEDLLALTIEGLENMIIKENAVTLESQSSKNASIINSTTMRTRSSLKRTASFDEGYTTAESTSNSGAHRRSRARVKMPKKAANTSRSLSRNTSKNTTTSRFYTPVNKQPPTGAGLITPKVKENTPQVILRRPKQGEVVVSYQGSPVMTGSLMCDEKPNVNIPLPNGNFLMLQAETGLRKSQIPQITEETRTRLQILRDNLLKICSN